MLNKLKILLLCVLVCSVALCVVVNNPADVYAEASFDKCGYTIGDNLLYDSGFELDGTSEFTDAREISSKWKTASWAGADSSYWGYKNTKRQAYLICSASGLLDGENPVVYQDVAVQKKHLLRNFILRSCFWWETKHARFGCGGARSPR